MFEYVNAVHGKCHFSGYGGFPLTLADVSNNNLQNVLSLVILFTHPFSNDILIS